MSNYYLAADHNGRLYLVHGLFSRKGWEKKNHKYIKKIEENGKTLYFYTRDELMSYLYDKKKQLEESTKNAVKKTQTQFEPLYTQTKDAIHGKKAKEECSKALDDYLQKPNSENQTKYAEAYKKWSNSLDRLMNKDPMPSPEEVRQRATKETRKRFNDAVADLQSIMKNLPDDNPFIKEHQNTQKKLLEEIMKQYADQEQLRNQIDQFHKEIKQYAANVKTDKKKKYVDLDDLKNAYENGDLSFKKVINDLSTKSIEYHPLEIAPENRDDEEIIDALAGGDKTEGSCASLALAYIGNKAGYQVFDFRGGNSRDFFSKWSNLQMLTQMEGVDAQIIGTSRKGTQLQKAVKILDTMEEERDYCLAAGQHMAIVHKQNGKLQYLELQSGSSNGWKDLNNDILVNRFLCKSTAGDGAAILIDTESLMNSPEFISMLGFINTDKTKQQKGAGGHVR